MATGGRSQFELIERQGYSERTVADGDSLEDIFRAISAKTGLEELEDSVNDS